jgi:hypothetical protein
MATIRLGAWDNERVLVSAEYNAGNRRLTGITVVNNGAFALRAIVIHPTTRLEITSRVFSPGTTSTLSVITTLALVSLLEGEFQFPTQLNVQYPAP